MGTGAERSGGGEEMSARRVQVPQNIMSFLQCF